MKKYIFKIPEWVQPGTKKFIKSVINSINPQPEDEGLLMSLCANYDTMIQARDTIAREGVCLIQNGRTVRHPATAVLKQSSDLVIVICKNFRLTRKEAPEGFDKEITDADAFFSGR